MSHKPTRLIGLQHQTQRLSQRLEALSILDRRYSWTRLIVFVAGIGITGATLHWIGFRAAGISLSITISVFVVLVYFHRRIKHSIHEHTIWRKIKQAQSARLNLDWNHIPRPIRLQAQGAHPFEADLDLVGERSLHHLINTATSREGSKRLHNWISNTNPDLPTIHHRQKLIQELARMPRFRDKLILYSTITSSTSDHYWDNQKLLDWLEGGRTAPSLRQTLFILIFISALNITLFWLYNQHSLPPLWIISFLPYVGLTLSKILRTGGLFNEAVALGEMLGSLKTVFNFLEMYPYRSGSYLKELCQPFLIVDNRPSSHLRRITRVISAASLQRTQLLWLFVNAIVPWDIYFAHRLDQLKAELRALLPTWLDVWFEIEALNSLANLAYLHPEYVLPDFETSDNTQSFFQVQALGHPLIPDEIVVKNNFTIHSLGDVTIVTGSNMSGKSSFLRTLGTNLCLANAGGPVNAAFFRTSLFRVFTCIQVQDSVTDGISYFYAEVKRLKALLSALEANDSRPLFFFIDEIFRGTNNRERLIGSRAYVRALAGKNGVGVVSTHDLELVKLAETIQQISNYHFEESVVNGEMVFDYQLRPGPSPTTNALKIMHLEGLPVDFDNIQ